MRNNLAYAGDSLWAFLLAGVLSAMWAVLKLHLHHREESTRLYGNDMKNTGSGELQVEYYVTYYTSENNIAHATSQGLLIKMNYANSEAYAVVVDQQLVLLFGELGHSAHFILEMHSITVHFLVTSR